MTIKAETKIRFTFPFRLYWQQLFGSNTYVKLINPFYFWRKYKINHLKNCWDINTIGYLERCRRSEWQSPQLNEGDQIIHKIFVSQQNIKLKYRGVVYSARKIVLISNNSSDKNSSSSSKELISSHSKTESPDTSNNFY